MSTSRILQVSMLMIFFVMSTFSVQAQAPEDWKKDARRIWLKGFEYYEKGEKSKKNGQLRESLTLFKESMRHFDQIKEKYPKWNTVLITYRIKLCNKKLEELKIAFEKQNIKFTATEIDKENLLLKSRLTAKEKKLKDTKKQLDTTYASLETARRKALRNGKVSDHIEQLLKEKVELTNRCALLEDRNKQLQTEAGKQSGITAEKTSLDKALLQIETLKKEKDQFIAMIETEKQRYVVLAGKRNDLAYQLKLMQNSGKVIIKNKTSIDKRVAILEESVHQAKKEQERQIQQLKQKEEQLKQANATIVKLRNNVKQIKSNANIDAGVIATQLENDNELMLKSLETANLKLIQKNKQIRELKEADQVSKGKITLLEQTLASVDKNRENILTDLKMFNKKVFISDTITKKQDQTIIDQKEKYEKLKKDFDALTKQHKQMTNKEDDFTKLAQQSIAMEGKNHRLKDTINKIQEENKTLINSSKQVEIDVIKSQNNYKEIVNQMAKIEQENLQLKVKHSQENQLLSEKCRTLTNNLNKIRKSSEEYDKKIELLTNELISVNSALAKNETELAESHKNRKISVTASKPILKIDKPRPSKTPEYTALKRENSLLLGKLNEKDKEILELKNTPISSAESKVNKAEAKKLLDSAKAAEKNGKNKAAIWYYERLLAIESENVEALAGLGIIEATNSNDKKAIPLLLKSLAYNSDNMDALLALTFCYIRQEKHNLALGAAARASAIDPQDPTIQRYMGIICSCLGWNQAAESQFRNSFKLDPTSSETAYNAAVHIAKTNPKRMKEAKLWYKRAIQLGAQRDPAVEKLFK